MNLQIGEVVLLDNGSGTLRWVRVLAVHPRKPDGTQRIRFQPMTKFGREPISSITIGEGHGKIERMM